MRVGTFLKLAVVAVLALIVALVAVVKSIDVERYRDVIAQAAKAATGRDLEIRGKLSLKLSLSPALIAQDVVFANAPWGSRPDMARLQRLEAVIGLLPLLTREVQVNRLVLVEPDLLLERDATGRANWRFDEAKPDQAPNAGAASGTPTTLRIAQLRVERAHLAYRDGKSGRNETLDIDRLTIDSDNPLASVGVALKGRWDGRPAEISGVLGPMADLLAPGKPYPVKLKAVVPGLVAAVDGTITADARSAALLALKVTADSADLAELGRLAGLTVPALGAARMAMTVSGPASAPSLSDIDVAVGRGGAASVTAKGSVKRPLEGRGVDLVLAAEGENLAGFNKSLDLALPALGPLKMTGRLSDVEGGWRLADLKATLGRSDAVGDVRLRLAGGRPVGEAHLASNLLDLDEVLGPHGEAARDKPGDDRLFSDRPLPLASLSLADVDLTWKIERLTEEQLLAQKVELAVGLKAGKLTVAPRVGNLAGGRVSGNLTLDAAAAPPTVALDFTADKVGLGEVLKGLKVSDAVHGARTDMRVGLKGAGTSVRAIMAKLDGETVVVADKGSISGAYADAVAVDVLNQLAPWSSEKNTDMQCLVSRFTVTNGMARSEAMLFDTSRMTVGGQGSVNLANESLDLTLAPKPKEPSLLSLAVPLDVGGTLTQPSVAPNKGAIVKGVASAVGGLALGPLGLLVPLVSAGNGDANPCVTALAQAQTRPKGGPGRGKPAKPSKDGGVGGMIHGLFGN